MVGTAEKAYVGDGEGQLEEGAQVLADLDGDLPDGDSSLHPLPKCMLHMRQPAIKALEFFFVPLCRTSVYTRLISTT
jgi:hypothetical protein